MMEIRRWQYTDMQDEGFNVRDDYSGRGMYGRTCFGFTGSVADLVKFIMFLSDLEIMERWIEDVVTDSMGRDTIFYWPNVTVEKGVKKDAA